MAIQIATFDIIFAYCATSVFLLLGALVANIGRSPQSMAESDFVRHSVHVCRPSKLHADGAMHGLADILTALHM